MDRPVQIPLSLLTIALAACHHGSNPMPPTRDRARTVVSPTPPDFVDGALYSPSNLTKDTRYAGWFMRDIVVIRFAKSTTQPDRQAAVDAVEGAEVGGRLFGADGDGLYLIRLPTDTTNNRLLAAIATLKNLKGVRSASPNEVYFGPVSP